MIVSRAFVVSVLVVIGITIPTSGKADVVDEAFSAGTTAAAEEDWDTAVRAFERARQILPGRAALLSYNLGTAYAELGRFGYAAYHLQRATQAEAKPSAEVVEASRRNLAIVRHRAEMLAEESGARISDPADWRDLVLGAFASSWMAWLAVVAGWSALALFSVRRRLRRRAEPAAALPIVFAAVFIIASLTHVWARGADRTQPGAVVLHDFVPVREGPGAHQKVEFTLQGGSWLLVDETRASWVSVRLKSGLSGWVPADAVARLDALPSDVGPGVSVGESATALAAPRM